MISSGRHFQFCFRRSERFQYRFFAHFSINQSSIIYPCKQWNNAHKCSVCGGGGFTAHECNRCTLSPASLRFICLKGRQNFYLKLSKNLKASVLSEYTPSRDPPVYLCRAQRNIRATVQVLSKYPLPSIWACPTVFHIMPLPCLSDE